MDISMWFPVIEDVANVYQSFRRNGQSREEAVNSTLKAFDIEQLDRDDEALIYIGLAKCTGTKKELTEAILNKSIQAFESLKNEYPSLYKELDSAEERINNKQLIGPEAHYKQKKRFVLHWEIGDTFICRLTGDYPKQYAMEDWYAIIRKADAFIDNDGNCVELVYLSVCEPWNIPRTVDDINNLGYIPVSLAQSNDLFEFKGGILVHNQKELERYQLEYIGNFREAIPPQHEAEPNHLTYYPLFPRQERTSKRPEHPGSIALQACYHYRKFGRLH